jgi:hypothetical protein
MKSVSQTAARAPSSVGGVCLEQAVFASARTSHGDGYQLLAKSRGISASLAREISRWCPTHDSLLNPRPSARSINFHPLSDGLVCLARTVAAGEEHSRRGGPRVLTHCLVTDDDAFGRLGNNPLVLMTAATWELPSPGHATPSCLPPVACGQTAGTVDRQALDGRFRAVAALLDAALTSERVGIVSPGEAIALLEAFFNVLPPAARVAQSFSSGLVYSPRRPFRLVFAPDDKVVQRRWARQYGLGIVDLTRLTDSRWSPCHGWAEFVLRACESGAAETVAKAVGTPGLPGDVIALDSFGRECLEHLQTSTV